MTSPLLALPGAVAGDGVDAPVAAHYGSFNLEQRALDAWAQGRLVVVKLDHGIPPVGLRDLPAIDASFEAAREFKWNEVADAVLAILRAPPPQASDGEDDAIDSVEPMPPPAQRAPRAHGGSSNFSSPANDLPGLRHRRDGRWLANRIVRHGRLSRMNAASTLVTRYGVPSALLQRCCV